MDPVVDEPVATVAYPPAQLQRQNSNMRGAFGTKVMPMGLNRKAEWDQELCECYKSPLTCIIGLLFPSCHFCYTVNRLGESACNYCCLTYFCGVPMAAALRSMARERYNIEGDYSSDVCLGTCCPQCVVCQVANEMDVQGM